MEALDGVHPFASSACGSARANIRQNILSCPASWGEESSALKTASAVLSHILTIEAHRWLPDEIVDHEYFAAGDYSAESHFSDELTLIPEGRERNHVVYWSLCKAAGIGRGNDGVRVSCVGRRGPVKALKSNREGAVFRLPWSWNV